MITKSGEHYIMVFAINKQSTVLKKMVHQVKC
jgi:hypothetical protein